jgi:hypothetical protein
MITSDPGFEVAICDIKTPGVPVMRAETFLDTARTASSEAMTRAVRQAAKDLKTPPYTVAGLLHALHGESAKPWCREQRKSSPLIHAEWGFGEAAQWCFDTLGTAICRLAHAQGLTVGVPEAKLYPMAFWRDP